MVELVLRQHFRASDSAGITDALHAIFGIGTAAVRENGTTQFEQESFVDDGISSTRLASSGAEVQVSAPPTPDLIVLAVHEGSLQMKVDEQSVEIAAGELGLVPLGSPGEFLWSSHLVLEALSFPTASIGRLLGAPAHRPRMHVARLSNSASDIVDLWNRTSHHLVAQILQKPDLFKSDIIREQAIDALLAITIEAFGISQANEDLPPTAHTALDAADDYMRLHLGEPISIPDVARAIGMSVRGLQLAYRTYRDTTPLVHLRQLRMEAAHEALASTSGRSTSVKSVAQSLAYTNLGRFSAHYREAHAQNPAETLRAAQGRPRP